MRRGLCITENALRSLPGTDCSRARRVHKAFSAREIDWTNKCARFLLCACVFVETGQVCGALVLLT